MKMQVGAQNIFHFLKMIKENVINVFKLCKIIINVQMKHTAPNALKDFFNK